VSMSAKIRIILSLLLVSNTFGQESQESQNKKGLPVLFQFSQPSHNVAVFRGAELKAAIAAGIVPGFGSLNKAAASASDENREGRSDDDSDADAGADASTAADTDDATPVAAPSPAPALKVVSSYRPAPVVYKPAPVIYKPAPVVYNPAPAPVVYRPAPAPVVYKPAPAPVVVKPAPVVIKQAPAVAYKPYVDPYPAEEALYTYEYAVKDDYTSSDFAGKEARDGILTNGQYSVNLPDGRLQTVTYTVNGGEGYVADVQYAGEAQYPPVAVPTYSS